MWLRSYFYPLAGCKIFIPYLLDWCLYILTSVLHEGFFHLLWLVTKVRLFVKSSVRRENLGTRLLSGSSIGWFHYSFVWNKLYFFLTRKPWYFMKKAIAFWSPFRSSTRETRNECSESSRAKLARWLRLGTKRKQIWRRSTQNIFVVKLDLKWQF